MNGERSARAIEQLVEGLRRRLPDDLPEGPYRDLCARALSPEDPDRPAWLQLLGVPQLVALTLRMLAGLLEERELDRMLEHSVTLNIYLVHEVTSDNLGIGLGHPLEGDDTRAVRRAVLLGFNEAMIERLRGGAAPARSALQPLRERAARIRAPRQSLSPDRFEALVRAHAERHPGTPGDALERWIWPELVANLESAARVADHVAGLGAGPLVRWGLIHRYRAVSALLEEPPPGLSRRAALGADSILVVPTLAYHVSALMESVRPAPGAAAVLEDGTLAELLAAAASLVRLLNDLGTPLLTSEPDRRALLGALRARCAAGGDADRPFPALLREQMPRFGALLGRLDKDLTHGEHNLALHGLEAWPARRGLDCFEARVEHLARRHAETSRHFAELSGDVAARLGDDRAVSLVRRFVRFHEHLYAHAYTSADGEYAV